MEGQCSELEYSYSLTACRASRSVYSVEITVSYYSKTGSLKLETIQIGVEAIGYMKVCVQPSSPKKAINRR